MSPEIIFAKAEFNSFVRKHMVYKVMRHNNRIETYVKQWRFRMDLMCYSEIAVICQRKESIMKTRLFAVAVPAMLLLAPALAQDSGHAVTPQMVPASPVASDGRNEGVITSYSIHYTKLYDPAGRGARASGFPRNGIPASTATR